MRWRKLNRLLTTACLFASISSGLRAQSVAPVGTRPNVVLILMDDMGYGDIGSYGVTDARTPNLDRLAREGIRLTDAYANASNCSPTRAGFDAVTLLVLSANETGTCWRAVRGVRIGVGETNSLACQSIYVWSFCVPASVKIGRASCRE